MLPIFIYFSLKSSYMCFLPGKTGHSQECYQSIKEKMSLNDKCEWQSSKLDRKWETTRTGSAVRLTK